MKNSIKEGDIYKLHLYPKDGCIDYHCFEGLLIAKLDKNNQILLHDMYWNINGTGEFHKIFTPEKAEMSGKLEYYCNINDIEPIEPYETCYYDDKDIFLLTEQHACVPSCKHYFKSKNATRSKDKMLSVLNNRISNICLEIAYLLQEKDDCNNKIDVINKGNLDITI